MSQNSTNENLQFIVDEIKNYFDSNDWKYEFDDENNVFSGGISVDGPLSSVTFYIFVHEDHAVCFHIPPLKASAKERPAQAEFFTRVNYNLARGCFEMDFSDGGPWAWTSSHGCGRRNTSPGAGRRCHGCGNAGGGRPPCRWR